MDLRSRAALLLASLLALLAVGLGVELVGRASSARLEIARDRPTELWPATRARLARLDDELVLTYFSSSPARTPSGLRGVRGEVERLLASLEEAAGGRLRWETAEPDSDPDEAAFAALARVKPVSVRSVTRDAWSEERVWSTLSIAYGARPRTQIAPITPATLGVLQGWITAQLDQLEAPARARVVVRGPTERYARLAERLAGRADVVRQPDVGALPREAPGDLVLWLDPAAPSDADARTLLAWSEAGTSVLVAASAWAAGPLSTPERPQFVESGHLRPEFLRELGLARLEGPLFDALCEELLTGAKLSWRVRAIAPNQDFRALEGQPNGTLVFSAPSALLADDAGLDALGFDALPLIHGGPDAWSLVPPRGPCTPAELAPERGLPAPKASLGLLLAPRDPRRGSLVVLGASNLLRDEELEREDVAHLQLVDVLLTNLASSERLVAARLRSPGAAPLPELSPLARSLARALCVLGVPLALALAAGLRLRAAGRLRLPRGTLRRAAGGAALLLLAAALPPAVDALLPRRADLTRARLHTLDAHTHALARALAAPLQAELYASGDLPPASADVPRRLGDLLRELERSLSGGLHLERHALEDLEPQARAELAARGIRPHATAVEAADERGVRQVWLALALSCAGRELVLDFAGPDAGEQLELRLALALGRLAGDARARGHVAIACDTPRLSPAEAHLDYQLRGLFAPTGADVYSAARAALERVDLRVTAINPAAPAVPEDIDLLVWLQPRRSIEPMRAALVAQLRAGGNALVAAQHFNVRARQLEGSGFRTVYWPEPQFPDLDEGWLADLGVLLVRDLVCDESQAVLRLPTEVQRAGTGRDFVLQESSAPFQLRVLAANAPAGSPLARGLEDQLFLWGNRIALDRGRLAELGLSAEVLLATSPRTWSIDWQGGYLTPERLAPPQRAEDYLGSQPLAVSVRGRFPAPAGEGGTLQPDANGPAAELVLLGASEPFKNPQLVRPDYRADHLLIELVCRLALGEDFARIAANRPRAQGFEAPAPERRLLARALSIGAWPALLALAALVWRGARRGARRAAA